MGVLMLAIAALVGGCSPSATPAATVQSVTGIIVRADGPDAASVISFSLRTAEGRVIDFSVGTLDLTGGGLPAPHIREHMLGGTLTTVFYRAEDGHNVAVKYTDADS